MSFARTLAAIGLLVGVGGCGLGPSGDDDAFEADRERVQQMTSETPDVLLDGVDRAYRDGVVRVRVTRRVPGEDAEPHTYVADGGAWRVDVPVEGPGGAEAEGVVLERDGELCFDEDFRATVTASLAESGGRAKFDPEPWTCTESGFGVNNFMTFAFRREDPAWRLANLTREPGGWYAEAEELEGEPALHVTTTGVTYDGPLDPARPIYHLWVDADHRPVRMVTELLTWDFEYPEDEGAAVVLPGEDERGSYGFATGPGQAQGKACRQGGEFRAGRLELTWGDGRES